MGTTLALIIEGHNLLNEFGTFSEIQSTLAMLYFVFFCGIAMVILGSLIVLFKKRYFGLEIALVSLVSFALIVDIVAIALLYSYLIPSIGTLLLVDMLIKPAIIALLATYIYKNRPLKIGVNNNTTERVELLKKLKNEGTLTEAEYKEQLIKALEK